MALSNITVTSTEANVQVDITNTTVTVGQTISNVNVGVAAFVSNAEIRNAITFTNTYASSGLDYNQSNGVITYNLRPSLGIDLPTTGAASDQGNISVDFSPDLFVESNTSPGTMSVYTTARGTQLGDTITSSIPEGTTTRNSNAFVVTNSLGNANIVGNLFVQDGGIGTEYNTRSNFEGDLNLIYEPGTQSTARFRIGKHVEQAHNPTYAADWGISIPPANTSFGTGTVAMVVDGGNLILNDSILELTGSGHIDTPSITTSTIYSNNYYANSGNIEMFSNVDVRAPKNVVLNEGNLTVGGTGTPGLDKGGNISAKNILVEQTTMANGELRAGNVSANVVIANYLFGDGSNVTGLSTLTNTQAQTFIQDNGLNGSGDITMTGLAQFGNSATQTHTFTGNVDVTGNIEVSGNLNYRNVEDLYVRDQSITLNANAATDATVQIIANRPVAGANTVLRWNETDDKWQFTNDGSTYQDLIGYTNLSVTQASASGAGTLAYNNTSGVFTYTPPDLTAFGLTNAQAQAFIEANGLDATANISTTAFFEGDLNGAVTIDVYNNTGAQLNKGDAVYLTGGNTGDNPNVALADADDVTKMPAIGIVRENIADTAVGQVVTSGEINYSSHGFTLGADLFIGTTAGALTETAPTGESGLIQKIGKVVSSNHILVQGAFRTNATPNLDENNIFIGNAANRASTVALDNLTANIKTTGNLQVNPDTVVGGLKGLTFDSSTNRLGLGTTTPSAGLHIFSNSDFDAQVYLEEYVESYAGPDFRFFKARGTSSSANVVQAGDRLADYKPYGHTGNVSAPFSYNGFINTLSMVTAVDSTSVPNDTTMPTLYSWEGYKDGDYSGGTGYNSLMKLRANGDFQIGNLGLGSSNTAPNFAVTNSGVVDAVGNITTTANISGNYILGNARATTGIITTNVAEGTNLYYTDARSRAAVSVTQASASGSGTLSYDNGTGVFTYTPPDIAAGGISNAQAQAFIQSSGLTMTADITSDSLIKTTGNLQVNPDTIVGGLKGLTFDSATNRLGLGTTTPSAGLHIYSDDDYDAQVYLEEYKTDLYGPDLRFFKARGTSSSPTAAQGGDRMADYKPYGHTGNVSAPFSYNGFINTLSMVTAVDITNAVNDTTMPTLYSWEGYKDGDYSGATPYNSLMKLRANGDFQIGNLGFGASNTAPNFAVTNGGDVTITGDTTFTNANVINGVVTTSANVNINTRTDTVPSNATISVAGVQAYNNGTLTEDSIDFTGGQIFDDGTAVTYSGATNVDVTPLNGLVFYLKWNSGDLGRYELFDDSGFTTGSRRVTGGAFYSSGLGQIEYVSSTDVAAGGNLNIGGSNAVIQSLGGNITSTGNISGSYILGDGSQLTNLPTGGDSFGTITVAGQTNIQATQSNAILDIASSGAITLSTSGNTLTIGGSGGTYGNSDVETFLGSDTMSGDIVYTGNLQLSSANVSTAVTNYQGNAYTATGDRIIVGSDPGWFNGQYVTFSGTTNSNLTFLNGNTYQVAGSGTAWTLYTNYQTFTKLETALNEESPTGLTTSYRQPENTTARVHGNVFVEQGGTMHTDALVASTPGKVITLNAIRATDFKVNDPLGIYSVANSSISGLTPFTGSIIYVTGDRHGARGAPAYFDGTDFRYFSDDALVTT
jgi:hypothetical protein